MYLSAPLIFGLLQRSPPIKRLFSIIGFIIVTIALIAASFASNVVHLILTQGVLFAAGGAMLYSPTIFHLDEWFVARKASPSASCGPELAP
jgi:hypothetical protein